MSEDIKLSLEYLRKSESFIPGLSGFPSRILADTYTDFVAILNRDVDKIFSRMQQNRELLNGDCEDRLTIDVVNQLVAMGYDASHDEKYGGHADLLVKKEPQGWVWIAEAKIHSSYDYLVKGFNQLTTRYSNGSTSNNCGALFIYIKSGSAKKVMNSWGEKIASLSLPGYSSMACNKNDLAFNSTHVHSDSGLNFYTRHIPLILIFNPQDR